MIGAEELTAAAKDHMERLAPVGDNAVRRLLYGLGVDPSEFQALAVALRDARGVKPRKASYYAAGLVDGFVLGVRAARLEAQRGAGQ